MTPNELLKWRLDNELSQEEAAKLIGCSRRGYQNWEEGKSKIPRYVALAIAAIQVGLAPYGTN